MKDKSTILIFLDEEPKPIAEFISPVNFELDTRKMTDGKHTLRIISKDPTGKEGLRVIPFEVRNGPSIAIEGISENAVVDGVLPLMINAYGKGDSYFTALNFASAINFLISSGVTFLELFPQLDLS